MSYTFSELYPKAPVLKIDTTEIKLTFVTLRIESIIEEDYGSIAKMYKMLNKYPEKIISVIWLLVEDKSKFENDLEIFHQFVFSSRESSDKWAGRMSSCLTEAVEKSSPLIKNPKRYKELQEINQATTDKDPCYVGIFDAFASRYGMSLEDFYSLTLRQIHMILTTMEDKRYEELEVKAALAGRELKPRLKFKDITEEEDASNEQQAMDALNKLRKKYEDNKGK